MSDFLLHLVPELHPSGIIRSVELTPNAFPAGEKVEYGVGSEGRKDVNEPLAWFPAPDEAAEDFKNAVDFLAVPYQS